VPAEALYIGRGSRAMLSRLDGIVRFNKASL